jgi:hypothetical protein
LSAAEAAVVRETDSAFVVKHPDGEFLFWAMDPANHPGMKPIDVAALTENLTVVRSVGGVTLHEGSGEWGWGVHGLNVWVASYSGEPPTVAMIVSLLKATASVPYMAPEARLPAGAVGLR